MKVRALVNVLHGVTNEITCKKGEVFSVKEIIYNPPCLDFVEAGLQPIDGKCYVFHEMSGLVHRSDLFEMVESFKLIRG